MKSNKSKWREVCTDYIDEEKICYVDAWKGKCERGETVAWIDMLSGRVIYRDPVARVDAEVQQAVEEVVISIKKQHPYSVEELERMLFDVVHYACEDLESGVDVEMNLISMGLSADAMHFFGFPEVDEEE